MRQVFNRLEVAGYVRYDDDFSIVDVGIDFHGDVDGPMVQRLTAALGPHESMFVEDPVISEFEKRLPKIAEGTSIPIAAGERLHTRFAFKRYFKAKALDVAQLDVARVGGITEAKQITDAAASYDVGLASHCSIRPIAFAASIPGDGGRPQCAHPGVDAHHEGGWERYVEDPSPLQHEGGYVNLPTRPGLSGKVDEETVRKEASERGCTTRSPANAAGAELR